MDLHLVIDRYLQGTLTEGEIAEFEERLTWDQVVQDELDIAERLRDGLRASVAEERYIDRGTGFMSRLSGLMAVPQYAAAASFVLAVVATTGVFLNPVTLPGNVANNQTTPTEIVPLFALRGNTAPPIRVNADAWTVLLVDVASPHESFRVTIRRDGTDVDAIWVQDGLPPTYPESLAIGMPGSLLAAGRFVLSLDGVRITGSGEKMYEHIQNIPFETTASR